ncbi:hypothetical protein [Geomicrobium sp. JCM 19037]|uniref:hypothetical protein n=1 Tax=Geomicrobium sp. JCM 19037 TaxID=1460634 RepID=UPI0005A84FD5|nr:hypothetical protein [Geomicrobium sp. JCM 19037]
MAIKIIGVIIGSTVLYLTQRQQLINEEDQRLHPTFVVMLTGSTVLILLYVADVNIPSFTRLLSNMAITW